MAIADMVAAGNTEILDYPVLEWRADHNGDVKRFVTLSGSGYVVSSARGEPFRAFLYRACGVPLDCGTHATAHLARRAVERRDRIRYQDWLREVKRDLFAPTDPYHTKEF